MGYGTSGTGSRQNVCRKQAFAPATVSYPASKPLVVTGVRSRTLPERSRRGGRRGEGGDGKNEEIAGACAIADGALYVLAFVAFIAALYGACRACVRFHVIPCFQKFHE